MHLNSIYSIARRYEYIGIGINNIIDLVKEESIKLNPILDEIKVEERTNYINKYFNDFFDNYVSDLIKEDETKFQTIVNKYINYKLKETDIYNRCLNRINDLSSYLKRIKYTPSPNEYITLITSNRKLYNYIEVIVEKNINEIKNNKADIIFSEDIAVFVKLFCMINNIEIDEEQDISEEFYQELNLNSENSNHLIRDYIETKKIDILSKDEEMELIKRIKQGDTLAREKFLLSNLRYVLCAVKRYKPGAFDYNDLVQEAFIGLTKALDYFDISKGYKFTTYADFWIRQSISHFIINNIRNIRIPYNQYLELSKFIREYNKIKMEIGYEPTIYELYEKIPMSKDKIDELYLLKDDTLSIDTLDDEDESIINDITVYLDDIFEGLTKEEDRKRIISLIDNIYLDEKIKDILYTYYGINCQSQTLNEIGEKYHCSHEWIRQLKEKGLERLRKGRITTKLAEFTIDKDYSLEQLGYKKTKIDKVDTSNPSVQFSYYIKASDLLKKEKYKPMKKLLGHENAIIVLLRFGYINNVYFPTKDLAVLFGKTDEEVRQICKEGIFKYKESLRNKEKQLIKK